MNARRLVFGTLLLASVLTPPLLCAQSANKSSASASAAPVAANAQHIQKHQAEIQVLQKDLQNQESQSKLASVRLQQQDQAIAQLRQQLRAIQGAGGPK